MPNDLTDLRVTANMLLAIVVKDSLPISPVVNLHIVERNIWKQ